MGEIVCRKTIRWGFLMMFLILIEIYVIYLIYVKNKYGFFWGLYVMSYLIGQNNLISLFDMRI